MRGVLLRGEHASDAAGDLLQVQVPDHSGLRRLHFIFFFDCHTRLPATRTSPRQSGPNGAETLDDGHVIRI